MMLGPTDPVEGGNTPGGAHKREKAAKQARKQDAKSKGKYAKRAKKQEKSTAKWLKKRGEK